MCYELGKREPAIIGHFKSGGLNLGRQVNVGSLAFADPCWHAVQGVRNLWGVNKNLYLILLFLAVRHRCVIIAHMTKERTNIYLRADVKKRAFDLANKGGMSLSVYVTQLIMRELAIEDGKIDGELAIYTKKARSK